MLRRERVLERQDVEYQELARGRMARARSASPAPPNFKKTAQLSGGPAPGTPPSSLLRPPQQPGSQEAGSFQRSVVWVCLCFRNRELTFISLKHPISNTLQSALSFVKTHFAVCFYSTRQAPCRNLSLPSTSPPVKVAVTSCYPLPHPRA